MTPLRRRAPIAGLLVALALLAAACGSSSNSSNSADASPTTGAGKDYQWVMVTDQAGLGDQGFNDLAYAGITKSAKDLGGTGKALESSEQAQYVPNLQQAVDDGASLVVGVGFLITDAIVEVAQASPNAHFLSIDNVAADKDGTPLPNVASVTFKENEGAYLAGVIAGLTTKTNKIGFAGGLEIPPVVRFLKGFQAGLKSVNPKATVNVAYVGGFGDAAKTKELAAGYYDDGADIVFEVAGAGGLGAYEEAKARGAGHWVIGTDTCKDALAPDNFLTSATKDVSGAVEREAKAVADGSFKGGVHNLGLAEDSVGVCQKTFGSLPKTIQDAVTKATADIKSGAITVPAQ
ncbi:MAG: family transporter substrate-binding protein [Acidimicrobiales bacterium]|nr:family transporter substrate-binding protein [Acidimicrobiales bacterium]